MKVRLKELYVSDLDRPSAELLNSFIAMARLQEGVELNIEDDEIIYTAYNMGRHTKNSNLRMVFLTLQRQMRKHLQEQSKQQLKQLNNA